MEFAKVDVMIFTESGPSCPYHDRTARVHALDERSDFVKLVDGLVQPFSGNLERVSAAMPSDERRIVAIKDVRMGNARTAGSYRCANRILDIRSLGSNDGSRYNGKKCQEHGRSAAPTWRKRCRQSRDCDTSKREEGVEQSVP
jgi:hypothetical protein